MTTDSELRELVEQRALATAVDELLEEALRDRLPLEAYVPRLLSELCKATGSEAALLQSYDENLTLRAFGFPDRTPFIDEWLAQVAVVTDERQAFVARDAQRTIIGEHLDVAGELFGCLALRIPARLSDDAVARATALIHVFAELIDNQLAFIAIFRKKSIVARELSDALMDPVLDRGIDAALDVLKSAVSFDDLLLVVRDEHAAHGARLTFRIIQGGVLTHEADIVGSVSVDGFIREHAAAMIHGDASALLAKIGITRFREEALIQGVRDKRVLGKLIVASRRGELSIFDRDVLERFSDVLRQRLVDHARQYRHLALSFPRATVERLLGIEDHDMSLLSPREREVAMLFADLSGFTRISEQVLREPALIAGLVDAWSKRVVEVVFELGGVFDKMVGDCVIALFGPAGGPPRMQARGERGARSGSPPPAPPGTDAENCDAARPAGRPARARAHHESSPGQHAPHARRAASLLPWRAAGSRPKRTSRAKAGGSRHPAPLLWRRSSLPSVCPPAGSWAGPRGAPPSGSPSSAKAA
jgi:adenylate cyclase